MEIEIERRVGREMIVIIGIVMMDCLGKNECKYVSEKLIKKKCVKNGKENVNERMDGMGICD
jgi:hypothetical protein